MNVAAALASMAPTPDGPAPAAPAPAAARARPRRRAGAEAAGTHGPGPLPRDVRWMNRIARAVLVLLVLALLAAGAAWIGRAPWFAIRGISLEGDLQRNNLATVRAHALPHLQGHFFTLDLQQARAAFEKAPWVRQAVVRRVFPGQLVVHLEEHRPLALWQDDDRGDLLVNQYGEVFDANLGDVEDQPLPIFSGPPGTAPALLAMHGRLRALMAPMQRSVDSLELSGRGSWRAVLDNGTVMELGRGSEEEVVARVTRFLATWPQVQARFQQALERVDLRHTDGYAVRMRGVTTTVAPPAAPRSARPASAARRTN
jgi:cell division protein FtsQ